MSKSTLNSKQGQIMGLSLFLAVGLILAAVGAVILAQRLSDKKRCTQSVPAVVVDLVKKTSHRKKHTSITYAPVFEYEYAGKTYQYESGISSRPAAYNVGDKVTLMIDPNDPHKAFEPGKSVWVIIIVCIAIGGLFAAIGGIGLITALSKKKTKDTLQ